MNAIPASSPEPVSAVENDPAAVPSRGRLFLVWTGYLMVCLFAVGGIIFAFDYARGKLTEAWLLWLLALCLFAGPLLGAALGAAVRLHYSAHDLVVGFFAMLTLTVGSEIGESLGGGPVRILCVGTGILIGGFIGNQIGRLLFKDSPSPERSEA